jgi:hypothetical protein
MVTLYRDDDPNVYTNAYLFKQLHCRFIAKRTDHYVALLMKDLWDNHALFWYLATAPYLKIGIHGWTHKDYSVLEYDECLCDLKRSLEYWRDNSTRMIGNAKPINTFFAPWNREGSGIKQACREVGLKFCAVKEGPWGGYNIKSFHWWNIMDDNFNII